MTGSWAEFWNLRRDEVGLRPDGGETGEALAEIAREEEASMARFYRENPEAAPVDWR